MPGMERGQGMDRVAALRRVLSRLTASNVTLAESLELRQEMQRLLETSATRCGGDLGRPTSSAPSLGSHWRDAC